MLFVIGAGLGFIYWKMKAMPLPFLGGRTKALAPNICTHLNIQMKERETASVAKAWRNVAESLDSGRPVALQFDCFYLDYFTKKIHFAGHASPVGRNHLTLDYFNKLTCTYEEQFPPSRWGSCMLPR